MKNYRSKGFTLVELMIVVIIIGVLASVAYPAYIENAQAAKRSTAQADLLTLASYMERYFTENNTYVGATILASSVTNDDYDFSFPNPPATNPAATTFTLQAAQKAGRAIDKCGTMTLTGTGVTDAASSNCWR